MTNPMTAKPQKKPTASLVAPGAGTIEILPEITPAFAAELLARRHPFQRPLKAARVAQLAQAMAEGRWRWTSDTIKLDSELRVIDGQHRLSACVQAGVPLKNVPVATLTEEDVLLCIDQHGVRHLNDIRATMGETALPRVVSGAIIAETCDWEHWRGMPRDLQARTISECEYTDDLIALYKMMGRNKSAISSVGAMSGALHCIRKSRDAAMRFFGAVFAMNSNIEGVEQPMVRVLFTYLAESKAESFSSEQRVIEHAYKSISAYNHWRKGRSVTKLLWKGGPMPSPEP